MSIVNLVTGYSNSIPSLTKLICLFILVTLSKNGVAASSMDYTMRRLATEQNDAIAQYYLGKKYLLGKSVEQDIDEALKWLKLAAEKSNREAEYLLGYLYLYGKHVTQDYKYAQTMLSGAAAKNHTEAQFELANYYLFSQRSLKNIHKAILLYRSAVDREHSGALYILGKLLYEGKLIKKDKNEGRKLLNLAAEYGESKAEYFLKSLKTGSNNFSNGDNKPIRAQQSLMHVNNNL